MESRVAIIGIIIDKDAQSGQLNDVLHEYGEYIFGRMGIPYRKRNLNIISIAVDGPQDVINTMAGKIGRIPGITTKTAYSNKIFED